MGENNFLWNRIYSLAKEIHKLSPWDWMFESDIFGVNIPDTGRTYFVSIMGSGGEFHGLAAYRGTRALNEFWKIQEDPEYIQPVSLLVIPHIMLSFTSRDELSPGQLSSIKDAGLKFRGGVSWPSLEEIVPGYMPELPEGDSVSDAAVILEQVLEVVRRTRDDPNILYSESDENDDYLVREQEGAPSGGIWVDRFRIVDTEEKEIEYPVKYSKEDARKILLFPEKPAIIQLDLVMLPSPIRERGQKGYFPFVLLFADKKTGMVLGMKMLSPLPDLSAVYESVPRETLDELKTLGYRPRRIEVCSSLMQGLLAQALNKAGVRLMQIRFLESIDPIVASLMSNLEQENK